MNSDKIQDLYSAGGISGFAYLACVENGILTVEDAIQKKVFEEPCPDWASELRPFAEIPKIEGAVSNVVLDDSEREFVWKEIVEVYDTLERKIDVKAGYALRCMQKQYTSFESYLTDLLLDEEDFWKGLRLIKGVRNTAIKRAHLFVESIRKALDDKDKRWRILFKDHIETTPVEQANSPKLEGFISGIVRDQLSTLSVRSYNILLNMLKQCGSSYTSFYQEIVSKDFDPWKLRNAGKKSVPEIEGFVKNVIERVTLLLSESNGNLEEGENNNTRDGQGRSEGYPFVSELVFDYESFKTIFESRMKSLSARAYHAVERLFIDCGRSVHVFFDTVSAPGFNVSTLPAVGRKTAGEISAWIDSVRELMDTSNMSVAELERESKITYRKGIGLRGDVISVDAISSSIGHFALFAAIDSYLQQLNDKHRAIIRGQLKIYTNQVLVDRKVQSESIGLSAERIRQIRTVLLKKISAYIHSLSGFMHDYPNHVYSRLEIPSVNEKEQTSFNDNFIKWAISIVWPDNYELFGDIEKAFTTPYGYDHNLALVPAPLAIIYDFEGFIRYFEELKGGKRADDMSIPLRECLMQFFKDRIYYEHIEEIETECRCILSDVFEIETRNNSAIIEKNAVRNNSEWAEIIIREYGRPMSIDEIFEELDKRHPGKSKSTISLAGAVRSNPSIIHYGRSSTYGLREWTKGELRGGTIREFATEYLLSLEEPVAPLENIGQYVRQFRPSSSNKSIHSNLLLESKGAFSLFYDKEGNRCIGLSSYEYSGGYRKFNPQTDSTRDFKTSCTLLEQFVATKGHLPFNSGEDAEEKRLYRFWHHQHARYTKGLLEGDEAKIFASMVERFANHYTNKKEYLWANMYEEIKQLLSNGGNIDSLTGEQREWLFEQIRLFARGRMPAAHIPQYNELFDLAIKNVKRV